MDKVFVVDVSKCSGCRNCQISCKDEHCDQPWLPYAEAQPEIGQFWCKVNEEERGAVPVVRVSFVPTLCAHCADAPCEKVCANGAFKRREDGLLLVDPGICSGCGKCVDACPSHAIYFNGEKGIAQKCTGCAHLIDDGWSVPRCVDACPNDALRYGERSSFADELALAVPSPGLEGNGPRLFYLNLPKRFVAGALVDFVRDEVIVGAKAALVASDGSVVSEVETDEFGDFSFDQVEADSYSVRLHAEGYELVEVEANALEKDIYLGYLEARQA